MKFFKYLRDGGPESKVTGFFFIEIKSLFSVVLLRFADGSREAYHSHAFNALSWVLRGRLHEILLRKCLKHEFDANQFIYTPSLRPIVTKRSTFHQVRSTGTTWVFSLRGPWSKIWQEYLPEPNKVITLTHGRKEVQ